MISKRHLVGNSAWHGGFCRLQSRKRLSPRTLAFDVGLCTVFATISARGGSSGAYLQSPVPDLDLVNAYGDGSRDEAKPVDRISETSLPHAARAGGHPCRLDHAGLIGCPARRAGHREVFSPWSLEQACARFLRRRSPCPFFPLGPFCA